MRPTLLAGLAACALAVPGLSAQGTDSASVSAAAAVSPTISSVAARSAATVSSAMASSAVDVYAAAASSVASSSPATVSSVAATSVAATSVATSPALAASLADAPRVQANDNRSAAGRLRRGVLSIRLVAMEGEWFPNADDGRSFIVQAFAEEGRAPSIPGPLIRVPAGTEIHATIHNTMQDATLAVRGLHDRAAGPGDTLLVPPAGTREIRFEAGPPGTYFYHAAPLSGELEPDDRPYQLYGALIVDPPGRRRGPPDRVLVIADLIRCGPAGCDPFVLTVNGRSWPHTERLTYRVGEEVRWRVINATEPMRVPPHPMHLHGFHFRVDSRGDVDRDTVYAEDRRRYAVTEFMDSHTTMTVNWVPDRAGNWLFHCHVSLHMAPTARAELPLAFGPDEHVMHTAAHHGPGEDHALDAMGGMIVGVRVLAGRGWWPSRRRTEARRPRELRLLVQPHAGWDGAGGGAAYALQVPGKEAGGKGAAGKDGATAVPVASIPGPPIVLTRGEPVRITVVNQLDAPTAVHWHGLELESYMDGVPGWSGDARQVTPLIEPGDSFAASFTPPRAGTFLYHTHVEETRQLAAGLFGPILVLEPGQRWDPETDHILIVTTPAPLGEGPLLLNGSREPPPLTLRAGARHRLRIANIAPDDPIAVLFLHGDEPGTWTPVAKDGADLPPALRTRQEARLVFGPGEVYDFELAPDRSGTLRIETFGREPLAVEVRVTP